MQLQGPKLALSGKKKKLYLHTSRHVEPFIGILEIPTASLLKGTLYLILGKQERIYFIIRNEMYLFMHVGFSITSSKHYFNR